jgi:3-hydroxybutyryl-CoA dehydrogenase
LKAGGIGPVAVIGAGTMGNGIAHLFAQYGHPVTLIDVQQEFLDRARATIAANLERQVKKNVIAAEVMSSALSRITTALEPEAAAGADLVIEAVVENREVKHGLMKRLDGCCRSEAILASNTSSISITDIAAATSRPDRVIGMHFMNPVPLMKLVEVIRGHATSDGTTATILESARSLDKTPVEVNDYPGFISNRVLMPMINEAIYALMEGVATKEAIDTVMKLGMNHPMGPLALADFIGLDTCLSIMNVLHEGFGDTKYRACPLLKRMVAAGHLGKKTGKGFYEYGG